MRGCVGRISRTCHACAHVCVHQCVHLLNQSLGPAPSRSLPRVERSRGHGTAASSHSICASNTYLAPTVSLGFPHEETYPVPSLSGPPRSCHMRQRRVRAKQLKNQSSVTTRPRGGLQTPKSLALPPQLTDLLATLCLRQGSRWCVRPLPALHLYQGRSLLQGYPSLPGSQLPWPPIHTHTLKGSNSTEKPPTLRLC